MLCRSANASRLFAAPAVRRRRLWRLGQRVTTTAWAPIRSPAWSVSRSRPPDQTLVIAPGRRRDERLHRDGHVRTTATPKTSRPCVAFDLAEATLGSFRRSALTTGTQKGGSTASRRDARAAITGATGVTIRPRADLQRSGLDGSAGGSRRSRSAGPADAARAPQLVYPERRRASAAEPRPPRAPLPPGHEQHAVRDLTFANAVTRPQGLPALHDAAERRLHLHARSRRCGRGSPRPPRQRCR